MIPGFAADGNLPPGEHRADDWNEVVTRFGWNPRRAWLLSGLQAALVPLRTAGCTTVYLDGSFVTSKDQPGDYDAAWVPIGVDLVMLHLIEPVFFDFTSLRAAQKAKYFGEFFPSTAHAEMFGTTFYEFFQIDKDTGNPKGIVVLSL
jgi:hypothetical protein